MTAVAPTILGPLAAAALMALADGRSLWNGALPGIGRSTAAACRAPAKWPCISRHRRGRTC